MTPIQYSFNLKKIEKLNELKNYITQNDLEKALPTIDKEFVELRQRLKILK